MTLPDNVEELQKMVTDLRKENGDHRTKNKRVDSVLDMYSLQEQEFLMNLLETTGNDPNEGAKGFRDLAQKMLGEEFYEGLELPDPEPAPDKDTITLPDAPEEKESDQMTPEQFKTELDARDARAAAEVQAKENDAMIESVFAEIEELGFARGSEGFEAMLNMGGALANAKKEVDFKALAPKVRMAFDIESPVVEGEEPTPESKEEPDTVVPKFPSTSDAGGAGGSPTEPDTDYIAEAKSKGVDPWKAARERAEARFESAV